MNVSRTPLSNSPKRTKFARDLFWGFGSGRFWTLDPPGRARHDEKDGEDNPDLDETLDELVKDESSREAETSIASVVSMYGGCDEGPETGRHLKQRPSERNGECQSRERCVSQETVQISAQHRFLIRPDPVLSSCMPERSVVGQSEFLASVRGKAGCLATTRNS
jgi:hypothetical protein